MLAEARVLRVGQKEYYSVFIGFGTCSVWRGGDLDLLMSYRGVSMLVHSRPV